MINFEAIRKKIKDSITPFCPICRKRYLSHKHCNLCNKNIIIKINYFEAIKRNHFEHNIYELSGLDRLNSPFVCGKCFSERNYTRCCVTGKPFYSLGNSAYIWNCSDKRKLMSPYHIYSKQFNNLSSEGLDIVNNAYSKYVEELHNFIGGTKGEYIKGYSIDRIIRRIEVNGTDCKNPGEVEDILKKYCVQMGGNGFIKFFWDKKIEFIENTYIAGYGKKGNPYYKTERRTEAYFVGHAESVVFSSNITKKTRDC